LLLLAACWSLGERDWRRQISPQISARGSLRSVRSLGKGFVRKSGIVNSRIQHFEGRIQEVGSRATLPDSMQQMATLDAHLPPTDHFHALQRPTTSPRGQTHITSATCVPHLSATSLPQSSHTATTVQPLSSHGLKASESGGAATMVQRLSCHGLKASESGSAATMVQRLSCGVPKASESVGAATVVQRMSSGVLKAPESSSAATKVQRLSSGVVKASESGGAATMVQRMSSGVLKAPESCGATTTVVSLSSYSQKVPESCGAATMVQRLSSYGQKASESCGGSTYVSTAGESSEISQFSFAATSNRPQSSLDQDALDAKDDMSSKTRSKKSPSPVRLSFSRAANAVQTVQSPRSPRPRLPPPLFTHATSLQKY